MDALDRFMQQMESDPELKACKERLAVLEKKLKTRVNDEEWDLLLEWEAEWANYVAICTKRLYPVAYRDGAYDKNGPQKKQH